MVKISTSVWICLNCLQHLYLCNFYICAPLEQTAEENCSKRDSGKPSFKLIFDMGQSAGLEQYVFWAFTLPSIFKGISTAGFVPFHTYCCQKDWEMVIVSEDLEYRAQVISTYFMILFQPHFFMWAKQRENFAKLLHLCATKDR